MSVAKLFAIFLLMTVILAAGVHADEIAPMRWDGTVTRTFVRHETGNKVGRWQQQWTVWARWIETGHIDVKNKKGETTGRFTILADDQSYWALKSQGHAISQKADGTFKEFFHSMSGDGDKTIKAGWIYHSLSAHDPLKDILPEGSYHILSDDSERAEGLTHMVAASADGSFSEQDLRVSQALSFRLSQPDFVPISGNNILIAEDIKPLLTGLPLAGTDSQMRRIENSNTMQGAYESVSADKKNRETIRWNLTRRKAINPKLNPIAPEWRPIPQDPPATIDVAARLDNLKDIKGIFRFVLTEVSAQKGWAINAGDSTAPDLSFLWPQPGFGEPQKIAEGWAIETSAPTNEASVKIAHHDGGAWGKLKAQVKINNEWYDCITPDGEPIISLPRDDNENHIADSWEKTFALNDFSANSDQDLNPQGVIQGDLLTLYEEYRGVVIAGRWQATNPQVQDIFIYNEDALAVAWPQNPGLALHQILDQNELQADRDMVNFNSLGAEHQPKPALKLIVGNLNEDANPYTGPASLVGIEKVGALALSPGKVIVDATALVQDESLIAQFGGDTLTQAFFKE